MVNSGVFQSLTQSLSRELDCARQIEKQMESLQEIESLQELRTAQSRLAALERTHQSALEAREDGHVMVTKMVEDACGELSGELTTLHRPAHANHKYPHDEAGAQVDPNPPGRSRQAEDDEDEEML